MCENGINLVRRRRQVVEISEKDSVYDLEKEETIKVNETIWFSICIYKLSGFLSGNMFGSLSGKLLNFDNSFSYILFVSEA